MSAGCPGKCAAAVSSKTGYTSLLRTLDRVCNKINKHCSCITGAMIVDTREVHDVSQYVSMLQFLCSVMQLCGGFEPDLLLQPQVSCRRAVCESTPVHLPTPVQVPVQRWEEVAAAMPFEIFYGSRFGFNYRGMLRLFFTELMVASGALPAAADSDNKLVGALKVATKGAGLQFSSSARAAAFHSTITKGDLAFTKSFWNVTEHGLAHMFQGSSIVHSVLQHCAVMCSITVPAQPLPVPTIGNAAPYTLPFSGEVQCMLYSATHRASQPAPSGLKAKMSQAREASEWLVFHVHGGGFIAQTSKSHEIYLLKMAHETQAPVLSVNYTLAPDAQHPTQLHQCLAAYFWARANAACLGWTGAHVLFIGDSAGGNLVTSMHLHMIMNRLSIPRADFLILAYPVLDLSQSSSPSRTLSIIDPMLPFATLRMCLAAYLGQALDAASSDPLISPLAATDDVLAAFPPTAIFTGEFDPVLDDSAAFARRLCGLDRDVSFAVIDRAPHGFLNLGRYDSGCDACINTICDLMTSVIGGNGRPKH
jgi:acetyl esterase/lipase